MTHSVLLLPLILSPLIFLPPEERHAKHLPFAGTHTHSMLPTAFYLTFSLPRASLTGSLGQASAVELSLFHFLASLAIPGIADGTHGPYSQAAQDSTCSLNKKKKSISTKPLSISYVIILKPLIYPFLPFICLVLKKYLVDVTSWNQLLVPN